MSSSNLFGMLVDVIEHPLSIAPIKLKKWSLHCSYDGKNGFVLSGNSLISNGKKQEFWKELAWANILDAADLFGDVQVTSYVEGISSCTIKRDGSCEGSDFPFISNAAYSSAKEYLSEIVSLLPKEHEESHHFCLQPQHNYLSLFPLLINVENACKQGFEINNAYDERYFALEMRRNSRSLSCLVKTENRIERGMGIEQSAREASSQAKWVDWKLEEDGEPLYYGEYMAIDNKLQFIDAVGYRKNYQGDIREPYKIIQLMVDLYTKKGKMRKTPKQNISLGTVEFPTSPLFLFPYGKDCAKSTKGALRW